MPSRNCERARSSTCLGLFVAGPFRDGSLEMPDRVTIPLLMEVDTTQQRAELSRDVRRIELEGLFEGGHGTRELIASEAAHGDGVRGNRQRT